MLRCREPAAAYAPAASASCQLAAASCRWCVWGARRALPLRYASATLPPLRCRRRCMPALLPPYRLPPRQRRPAAGCRCCRATPLSAASEATLPDAATLAPERAAPAIRWYYYFQIPALAITLTPDIAAASRLPQARNSFRRFAAIG